MEIDDLDGLIDHDAFILSRKTGENFQLAAAVLTAKAIRCLDNALSWRIAAAIQACASRKTVARAVGLKPADLDKGELGRNIHAVLDAYIELERTGGDETEIRFTDGGRMILVRPDDED